MNSVSGHSAGVHFEKKTSWLLRIVGERSCYSHAKIIRKRQHKNHIFKNICTAGTPVYGTVLELKLIHSRQRSRRNIIVSSTNSNSGQTLPDRNFRTY